MGFLRIDVGGLSTFKLGASALAIATALSFGQAGAQSATSVTSSAETPSGVATVTSSDVLEAAQPPEEGDSGSEIVVTGIRASLAKSLEAKRRSDSIVDVITAEDIGKFPDANVAETLQRVPGVAIDRQAGEGRFASINGLGPEFVSVLVNGRVLANDNPDRSFSFDTLASQLVSSVKVYKTANAIVPEGGVAGTIDVITARPFDYSGFKMSVQAGGLYEGNAKRASPQGSFLISDQFMDGRLGLLASFNYFERRNRTYTTQNSAVLDHGIYFDGYAYFDVDGADAFRMQDLTRSVDDDHRQRIGGTVAAQFKATDNLLLTADYLYSHLKETTTSHTVSNYFYWVLDDAKNVRDADGVLTTFDHSSDQNVTGYAFQTIKTVRPVTTNAVGFNAKWDPSSKLSAIFDLSGSRTINANDGLNRDYTVEALNQAGFLVVTPPGGVPSLNGANLYVPATNNEDALRARITGDSGSYVKAENWQAKSDFRWSPSESLFFNFGGSFASQRKQNDFYQTPNAVRRLYQANALNEQIDTDSIITGIRQPGNVFGNSQLNSDMFIVDGEALRRWMADPVNLANRTPKAGTDGGLAAFIANGQTWDAVKSNDSYVVLERVTSAYADAHFQSSLLGRPFEVVGGLRYTHTDVKSSGTTRILIDLEANDPTGVLQPIYASDDFQSVANRTTYDDFLPSANVKWDIAKNMVLRLSASKTLTRPLLEDLAPSFTYHLLTRSRRTATAGNVDLKPFTSVNLDASYEWYYRKDSGFTVEYFHKTVDDYIISTTASETVTSVGNPLYQTFDVTRPRNAEKAKVEGVTAAWQHTFDFGLGFQANYTRVNGHVSNLSDPTRSTALPGVSDTANVVGFYENKLFGLRVAYNWRDKFLASPNYGGIPNEPRFYRPYSQIDARLSVNLPAGIGVALDAVNLTKSKVRSQGLNEDAFISYQDFGRRWTLTASKKF